MSYGERTEAVLSVLKENPGIFKHQIAAKLGLLSKDISGAMSALQGRDRIVQREGLYYLKENESKK